MNEALETRSIVRDVLLSQICFGVFIGICVALHPGFVLKANEGGMSNYGVHLKTFVPYTLALALAGALSLRASRPLVRIANGGSGFGTLLRIYGVLMFATLVSTYPYSLDTVLKDAHDVIGAGAMVFEFVATIWMFRRVGAVTAILADAAGFVITILTFAGILHLLFLSQVVVGLFFAYFLVRSAKKFAALAEP